MIGTYILMNMIAIGALITSGVLLLGLAYIEGRHGGSLPNGAEKSYTSNVLKRILSRAAFTFLVVGVVLLCVGAFFQHPAGITP